MEKQLIFQKIPLIMSKVWPIAKDRTNSAQGYKFRGIDDMYNALNSHLAEEKIFFTSEVLSTAREERETKAWWTLMYSIITMKFTAYAEDWSNVSSTTVGEAMDSWDKSMNKAMSTAYKYALMQIFCIPTEDEKDTETQTHEVKSKPQLWEKKEYPRTEADNFLDSMEIEDDIEHLKTIFAKLYSLGKSDKQKAFYKWKYEEAKSRILSKTNIMGASSYEDTVDIE